MKLLVEMIVNGQTEWEVVEAEIHRFYHKKLEKLGINPLTFENSQEIPN